MVSKRENERGEDEETQLRVRIDRDWKKIQLSKQSKYWEGPSATETDRGNKNPKRGVSGGT